MEFIKRSLGTLGTQLFMISLGLANNALVSHVLGADGQGAFVFITLIPIMLVTLGNLGIGISNVYFIGSKKFEFERLLPHSLILAFFWGSILVGSVLIFQAHTSLTFKVDWRYLKIAVFVVPFSMSTFYLGTLVLGLNQIKRYNLIQLAPKLCLFCWLAILLLLFNMNVGGTAWAYFGAEVLAGFGIILFVILKISRRRLSFAIRLHVVKEMLKFGLQGFFGNVLAFLNYRLDMFLILYFLDKEALGFYSISVLLVEKIWLIPNSIGVVLFPKISSGGQKKEFTPAVCRSSVFITFLIAFLVFFIGKFVILLVFPDEFIASVAPLKWLLPGIVLLGISKILTADLAGKGKPIYATIAMVVTVAINLGMNIFLIPKLHISGAALASTISYSANAVILGWFYKMQTGVKFQELVIPRKSDLIRYKEFLVNFIPTKIK